MKICFVSATAPSDVRWVAPLAFGYLKNAAPGHEYIVAQSAPEVAASKADITCISAVSQNFSEVTALADAAPNITIIGGYHITALPETLPGNVDIGVLGEGETTFKELMQALYYGDDWKSINGIIYHGENGIARTKPRELQPIDSLPIPDRDFGRQAGQKPYIFTSRGCPFKCSFCAPQIYWRKARYHSAERVVEEINSLGRKNIQVWDDLFAGNKKRLRRIAANLGSGHHFNAGIRADIVDDELCQLMSRIGMKRLGMGAESGVNHLLKKMKGSSASVEQNQNALDIMNDHGMNVGAGFIFGHPDETEDDIHQTYRWIMHNYGQKKLIQHEVNIMTPFPGTKIWAWAEYHGYQVREWRRLRHVARYSNNRGATGWWDDRYNDRSIYLNEDNVPQTTLQQIIEHYEDRIARGDFGPGGRIGAGTSIVFRRAKQEAGRIKRCVLNKVGKK